MHNNMPKKQHPGGFSLQALMKLIFLLFIISPVVRITSAEESRSKSLEKYTRRTTGEITTTLAFQPLFPFELPEDKCAITAYPQSPIKLAKKQTLPKEIKSFNQGIYLPAFTPYITETSKKLIKEGICAGLSRLMYLLSNEEFIDFLFGLYKHIQDPKSQLNPKHQALMNFVLQTQHLKTTSLISEETETIHIRLRDDSVLSASSIKELSEKLLSIIAPAKIIYLGTLEQFLKDASKMTDGFYLVQINSDKDTSISHEMTLSLEGTTLKFFDPNNGCIDIEKLTKIWNKDSLLTISAHEPSLHSQALLIKAPTTPTIVETAVELSDIKALDAMTKAGPHTINPSVMHPGTAPVFRAAMLGNIEAFTLLAKRGGDLSLVSKYGETVTSIAASTGHTALIEYLKPDSTMVNKLNKQGLASLHLAVKNNHIETAASLLKYGALVDIQTAQEGLSQQVTPLLFAMNNRNYEMVELLLKAGANPNRPLNHSALTFAETQSLTPCP